MANISFPGHMLSAVQTVKLSIFFVSLPDSLLPKFAKLDVSQVTLGQLRLANLTFPTKVKVQFNILCNAIAKDMTGCQQIVA